MDDCLTRSKFVNDSGCRHSLQDSIVCVTGVKIGGKRTLVFVASGTGERVAFFALHLTIQTGVLIETRANRLII